LYVREKFKNEEFRKQHSIADPLVALKIGRQTHHALARNPPKKKISFEKV